VNGDARLKPHTIANPDRVKLKFYSNVLGDNSTFIHYVSLVFIGEFNVVIDCAHHAFGAHLCTTGNTHGSSLCL